VNGRSDVNDGRWNPNSFNVVVIQCPRVNAELLIVHISNVIQAYELSNIVFQQQHEKWGKKDRW
jgi:hypothetical protein